MKKKAPIETVVLEDAECNITENVDASFSIRLIAWKTGRKKLTLNMMLIELEIIAFLLLNFLIKVQKSERKFFFLIVNTIKKVFLAAVLKVQC